MPAYFGTNQEHISSVCQEISRSINLDDVIKRRADIDTISDFERRRFSTARIGMTHRCQCARPVNPGLSQLTDICRSDLLEGRKPGGILVTPVCIPVAIRLGCNGFRGIHQRFSLKIRRWRSYIMGIKSTDCPQPEQRSGGTGNRSILRMVFWYQTGTL